MICSKAGGDAWALTQRTVSAWWNTQFEINYWNHSAVGKGIGSNWISSLYLISDVLFNYKKRKT